MAVQPKRVGAAAQDSAPAAPKKKKIKTTRDVNGVPEEVEIEIDDVGGPTWPERGALRLLEHDLPRVDGPDKLTGRARYTHDVRLPGMLFARLLACPFPVATVKIDTKAALAIAGVEAAIVLVEDKTQYLGQPVAAVAATTPEIADDALRALKVEFIRQPWAVDRAQALAENAPAVRKGGNSGRPNSSGAREDVDKAFTRAAAVVEATYSVPTQHHASLETHGVVVDYRGGDEATVYASTQATVSIGGEAASTLGLKASNVTTIVEHMGGGFGAKFGLGVAGLTACKLAKQLKKPVHLMLTRRDEFVMGGNRSGARQTLKLGASADGTFVALLGEIEKFGGLQDGSFPSRGPYIYEVKDSFLRATSIYTHTDTSVAMRAPGHPQASFGIESLIDELATKLGFDALELRKKNLKHPAYARQLDAVARAIGWPEHPNKTAPARAEGGVNIGIGFAVATWGGGGSPACEVDVKVEKDGSVSASVGSQDLGTGTRTYVAAIVAEELGLKLADVAARIGNSRYGNANGSGGSTTTASLAPAVKDAAYKLKNLFAQRLAPMLRTQPELVRFENGKVFAAADPAHAYTFGQACATLGPDGVRAHGTWVSDLAANGVHGAQAAKVEVDTLTGAVRVLEMVAMQDCGLPLNRLAVRSQLNGGMIQALGYGLLEERVIDPALGLQLNANLEEYKIPGTLEIPDITAMIDDGDERRAVIGMAEPAIIPGHGAIANAVFNACGARVRELPITPDKVLAALGRVG